MASPSDGSLSSGGLDQGSDAPTRDYEREVSGKRKGGKCKSVDKDEEVKFCHTFGYKFGGRWQLRLGFPVFQAILTKDFVQTISTLVLVFNMQKTFSVLLTWSYMGSEAPKNTGPIE